MDSREIVRKTLDFDYPERVAHSFAESDFVSAKFSGKTYATDWHRVSKTRWERTDEWGNLWARLDETSKGEVVKGVLENLDNADKYEFPDFSKPQDYNTVCQAREQHPDKWILSHFTGLTFTISRNLRKLDQYLMDLVLEPKKIHRLHNRVDDMLETIIRNHAAAGADSVMFWEDWGTQQQLMINPKMWVEEFYPRFARLCGVAHKCGVKIFMHSCGNISSIVPHLIKAGIDVLQFDQPELHGFDTLAAYQELGKVSFWCPVDIQGTLQTKNEVLIRAKARQMLDELWKGRGGFIAGRYDDEASIGLEPKWQNIASDEFLKYGVKKNYLS